VASVEGFGMKPLDLTDPIPGDRLEPPRTISIRATAHLLGVRRRQVWEWIIEGSLRSVVTDERRVICASIEELICNSAARLDQILREAQQPS
jgi:hypothetical protein